MATNISSKYEHIICKDLIQTGSPNVYQLKPKKGNIGNVEGITLKRVTLGERDPNKINKTILLVGETGAGKSTLINALVNYAMGVEWEDDVWYQIVQEEKKNQSESQTSDVSVYEIFGFEGKTLPYSLTIIDTPGYGDTRGNEEDATVNQRLFQLFRSSDGVHEINAVGLVLKASENRLSDRQMYIFNSVMSLFGNDMENIVALITHSNGVTPENVLQALEGANITCAKDEDDDPLHFMFDNCQSKQRTKKNKVPLKAAWNSTKDQIDQFTDYLKETSPQNLTTTVEVLGARTGLAACIQNLRERMELTELKQTEIKQTQEALKKHEEEMKSNENFMIEVDEPYKGKGPVRERIWWWRLSKYAVTCKVCEENCHNPCPLAWYPEYCEVMKGGHCTVCTVCTGKCPASDHVKEKWSYVTKTRKVKKTLEDVKEKYEKNQAGSESKLSLLETLKKEMEDLQKEKDRLLAESFQHLVRLEQIALNVDSLSTHAHVDFMIEKMKEKGDTEKVQKLEEVKARMEEDEGLKAALWYGYGKLKSAFTV